MKKLHLQLTSKHNNRPFLADATYLANQNKKPVIIFNHGFKGYKDWGPFHLVAEEFVRLGYIFVKMNFSHNGTTIDKPTEFADLEAFAQNNFSIELDDTAVLIDALYANQINIPAEEMDLDQLFIIGHSRGGSSAILKAKEDNRIKKIATWSAVNDIEAWYSKSDIEQWKDLGTIYIYNSRTEQQMPMHYQLVENYNRNKSRLDVQQAIKTLKQPLLAIHGTEDETVPVESLLLTKSWNPSVETIKIEGAGHTFGGTEPYHGSELPDHFSQVINFTDQFFKY